MAENLWLRRIDKRTVSRKKYRSKVNRPKKAGVFKPIDPWNIMTSQEFMRSKVNLDQLVALVIGYEFDKLRRKSILYKTWIVSIGESRKKLHRASLAADVILEDDDGTKTKVCWDPDDKISLLPDCSMNQKIEDKLFFEKEWMAKEYLLMNFLLKNCPSTLTHYFTSIAKDSGEGDYYLDTETTKDEYHILSLCGGRPSRKGVLEPHYVVMSHGIDHVVIYSVNNDGMCIVKSDTTKNWIKVERDVLYIPTQSKTRKRKSKNTHY